MTVGACDRMFLLRSGAIRGVASRYGPTDKKGTDMETTHYIPWAQIFCVLFALVFKYYFHKIFEEWFHGWLYKRYMRKCIREQQKVWYRS